MYLYPIVEKMKSFGSLLSYIESVLTFFSKRSRRASLDWKKSTIVFPDLGAFLRATG